MYTVLEETLDLNDPEAGFSATMGEGNAGLTFTDWKGRHVLIRFVTVYTFSSHCRERLGDFPEARFVEVPDSAAIRALRDDGTVTQDEPLRHFVISTNEGEWCEAIAERYEICAGGIPAQPPL